MIHVRTLAVASVFLFLGCGGIVDDTDAARGAARPGVVADAGSAIDTGASAVPPTGLDGGVDDPPPPELDAEAVPPPSDDPPATIDCFGADIPPPPRKPKSFLYERQVASCPSSDCSDFVEFDASSCVMKLQTKGASSSATLPPDDCNAFIRWIASDLLVLHLRDMATCYGKDVPGKYESTQIDLNDGWASKKTNSCTEEPFVSHRACIAKLRAKYFPGK